MACHAVAPAPSNVHRYQPRGENVLRALFRRHFAAFAEAYPALYARHYGRYRLPRIREVAEAFVRCGDPRFGVARLQCSNPECRSETFRPFSCQGYYLCPSCSQKRTLLFAEFLSRRLLLRLPHRVLTFTVPKILRPAFRFHPRLFAEVSRLIARLVRQFHEQAARQPLLSGFVLAYQSSGDFCRFHPHWHGVFLEGGFDQQGRFHHVPFGDLARMAQAFRRRLLALFLQRGLIERDRAEGLLCWKNSGFSLDGSIVLRATDPAAMERLAQYMARPPISLGKVTLEEQDGKVLFHTSFNPYFGENLKLFAVTDFIAELTAHIPPKGVHYIRRYGLYSSRTRSRWSRLPHILRLRQKAAEADDQDRCPPARELSPSRASSTWARLISKVWGEDPFVCPHCGHQMKVLAVITDPLQVDRILRHLVSIGRPPPGLDVSALQQTAS